MKIINDALLMQFRGPGACEHCKRWCRMRQPHHLYSRGCGGGQRLDVLINLIALGSAFDCNCHGRLHDGAIMRCDLLAIVAARENTTQDAIERTIYELRRAPKGSDPQIILARMPRFS
jgi:hypothetical protein